MRIRLAFFFRFGPLARLPVSASDGDVTEDTAFSPVPPAALAEVPRLRLVIIIVITKLCVE